MDNGVVVARKGNTVAKEYTFFLTEVRDGTLNVDDAHELIDDMKSAVNALVAATQAMVNTFDEVETDLKTVRNPPHLSKPEIAVEVGANDSTT